jgi:hypothetical protein
MPQHEETLHGSLDQRLDDNVSQTYNLPTIPEGKVIDFNDLQYKTNKCWADEE